MTQTPPPSSSPPDRPKRALILGAGFILVVLIVFALGKMGVIPSGEGLTDWLAGMSGSRWALPALIAVFCAAAFLGVPQFVLIATAVALFGPWLGFAYSWVACMISGTLTFWTGRLAGEETFRRYAGKSASKLSAFVGRNAFATSALVRNVPTGPFLLVNMAFGVSEAKFRNYLAGLAVGVLPKIALIAFAGQGLVSAMRGNPVLAVLAAAAAIAVYAGGAMFARKHMGQKRQSVALIESNEVDISSNRPE
jgi:uncharacterized membrane protein YdjX (TVP38/TMEM64 family)